MKLKDIKFYRFPICVEYTWLGSNYKATLVGETHSAEYPYFTDEIGFYGNYVSLLGEVEIVGWEYPITMKVSGAVESVPIEINLDIETNKNTKGPHKCNCPVENFTAFPIGCTCNGL